MADKMLATPPDKTEGLCIAVPERAVLESLYEVEAKQRLEEARNFVECENRQTVRNRVLSIVYVRH